MKIVQRFFMLMLVVFTTGLVQPIEANANSIIKKVDAFPDFDNDGYADLAIGIPGKTVNGASSAGAVEVIYGTVKGLRANDSVYFSQSNALLGNAPAEDDRFGHALTTADFNNDGFTDLAVGIPGETVNGDVAAGAVQVIYGHEDGLLIIAEIGGGSNATWWHQDSPGILDVTEPDDRFGSALTAGDFNDDGYPDLAIGTPGEGIDGLAGGGAVHILYGSAHGLTAVNDQLWHQNSAGILDTAESGNSPEEFGVPGDAFGYALEAGDFNDDTYTDLIIAAPQEFWPDAAPGAVHVLYGSASGITAAGNQQFYGGSLPIAGDPGTWFGLKLGHGDFDGNGVDDLAIQSNTDGHYAKIHLVYGYNNGLGTAVPILTPLSFSNPNANELTLFDLYGFALEGADFNDDGKDDLAVGIPGHDGAGAVQILFGSDTGLTETDFQWWSQDTSNIADSSEGGDFFGRSLTHGDYNGDGKADLGIGVPGEQIEFGGGVPNPDHGAVQVFYNDGSGISDLNNQFWYQNSPGLPGSSAPDDWFGGALP